MPSKCQPQILLLVCLLQAHGGHQGGDEQACQVSAGPKGPLASLHSSVSLSSTAGQLHCCRSCSASLETSVICMVTCVMLKWLKESCQGQRKDGACQWAGCKVAVAALL